MLGFIQFGGWLYWALLGVLILLIVFFFWYRKKQSQG